MIPEPSFASVCGRCTIYTADWRDLPAHVYEQAAGVLCDPPYGDDHNTDSSRFVDSPTWKGVTGHAHLRKTHPKVQGDEEPFDPAPLLDIGSQQVLWGMNRYSSRLPVGSLLVWDKRPSTGRSLLSDGEAAWWSKGRGVYIFEHCWHGFSRASENSQHYHPTQKPVALMRWALLKMKLPTGSVVFDPYMGSGPVGVACATLGLSYVGCELVPEYVEIARSRIEPVLAQGSLF